MPVIGVFSRRWSPSYTEGISSMLIPTFYSRVGRYSADLELPDIPTVYVRNNEAEITDLLLAKSLLAPVKDARYLQPGMVVTAVSYPIRMLLLPKPVRLMGYNVNTKFIWEVIDYEDFPYYRKRW